MFDIIDFGLNSRQLMIGHSLPLKTRQLIG